ncbi:hypothetical protein [Sinanaerobacter chloroacetimidivorans]|uniref:Uncharacterized protein n=1 Tax=Sinanaerobacter chloroacetimidivorans TaxID=2818044 RepID=A0A8J8B461_9FIRM|nr:hypothetical protein [Sinanaerobacter chloroacetimidivorans]MBR0599020.1 hypothetical protein [Sinanaerobacter chloroacetimidivorans]
MNFIDAHKIVHNYAGAMAKGADDNALLFRPLSYIPFQNKDKVIDAHKIFYSHMIFYNTRTQEQYEQYNNILKFLKFFVPDDIYKSVIKLVKKNKMKEASTFMSDYIDKPSYRLEEVEDYFSTMIDIKNQSLELYDKNEIKTMEDLIYNYCIRAYQHANIEYKEEYFYYFFKFDVMKDYVDDVNYIKYYHKYRDYILNNQ